MKVQTSNAKRDKLAYESMRACINKGHDVWWIYADSDPMSQYLYFYCTKCSKNMVVDTDKYTFGGSMVEEECPFANKE